MIWKTLRGEKPEAYKRTIVLTTTKRIIPSWFNSNNGKFYSRCNCVKPISNYKRWCYEDELVEQISQEIRTT